MLFVRRKNNPFKGSLAFPGGFVDYGEEPQKAVIRELKEECNLEGKEIRLITVAGKADRDPRGHTVSSVFAVKVSNLGSLQAGDDAAAVEWVKLEKINESPQQLAFDHGDIFKEFLKWFENNKNFYQGLE
eukprot:TRINITY_DN1831_c0_g1_i2.p1 TRINITY_DN1831_c0_g1~~TRINITY_DN1831_c0_g1_i2.p1  ORF type:complete len:130 (-),score=23.73 TRINITY_DN1831_c0_g1_i2:24-413(-)